MPLDAAARHGDLDAVLTYPQDYGAPDMLLATVGECPQCDGGFVTVETMRDVSIGPVRRRRHRGLIPADVRIDAEQLAPLLRFARAPHGGAEALARSDRTSAAAPATRAVPGASPRPNWPSMTTNSGDGSQPGGTARFG